MSYLTKIKLSGITNLSDARFAAAAGLDYISFAFSQSDPRHIPPYQAQQILEWISGPQVIAEFLEEPVDSINELCGQLRIPIVLLKGTGSVAQREQLMPQVWVQGEGLVQEVVYARQVVFTGNTDALRGLCAAQRIVVEVPDDMQPEAVREMVTTCNPYAISISGAEEAKVGMRDFDALNQLLGALQAEA